MARELTPEEKAQVIAFPIAYDGVGIVVHASNQIAAVTTDDLRRIYRKQVTNWSDFGGQNAASWWSIKARDTRPARSS